MNTPSNQTHLWQALGAASICAAEAEVDLSLVNGAAPGCFLYLILSADKSQHCLELTSFCTTLYVFVLLYAE